MAEEVISDQEDAFSAPCTEEGHRRKRHAPPQEGTPTPEEAGITYSCHANALHAL